MTDKEITGLENKSTLDMNGEGGLFSVGNARFRMITVEGGTFVMGATPERWDSNDNEKPAHQVTLSSYCIGETPVTQRLWWNVMCSNPSVYKSWFSNNQPVEAVSWFDCQIFIEKLNVATGKRFRLPTEAEWEFAARGGNKSKQTLYSGSDNPYDVAWFCGNSNIGTHSVKGKKPNELGIYDMSGNVWEWCQDRYGDYGSEPQTNPTGSSCGNSRVIRGGCWHDGDKSCRLTSRYDFTPDSNGSYLGFRLALSEPDVPKGTNAHIGDSN